MHCATPLIPARLGVFDLTSEERAMSSITTDLDEARRDLAAIFRWTAREGMHEGIANHFSYVSQRLCSE